MNDFGGLTAYSTGSCSETDLVQASVANSDDFSNTDDY